MSDQKLTPDKVNELFASKRAEAEARQKSILEQVTQLASRQSNQQVKNIEERKAKIAQGLGRGIGRGPSGPPTGEAPLGDPSPSIPGEEAPIDEPGADTESAKQKVADALLDLCAGDVDEAQSLIGGAEEPPGDEIPPIADEGLAPGRGEEIV
jgi:hypothetical protein